ncbi:unnamed protein product [Phytophthora fragariaefolia]|uniref:Unnamed protein product n=1 Tax=Phytophthora fragariaefolia TaxID=1490495 RepID=A0A9W6TIK8_9STRA|nr:unnamed protein product [Phytophthora fragariaefolia]
MWTSQNREKIDPEWFAALNTLREPKWMAAAKHIAFKNGDVVIANKERLHASNAPIAHVTLQHFVHQKLLAAKRDIPTGTVPALLNDAKTANSDHDRVVASKLKLCVGVPITFAFSTSQEAGLCNGTNGVVYDVMFVSGSELPIVLVQISFKYISSAFSPGERT